MMEPSREGAVVIEHDFLLAVTHENIEEALEMPLLVADVVADLWTRSN